MDFRVPSLLRNITSVLLGTAITIAKHTSISSPCGFIYCRLETEYEVLGHLGKGGFGLVLHVKKKLDNAHYAIKIIKLPNE